MESHRSASGVGLSRLWLVAFFCSAVAAPVSARPRAQSSSPPRPDHIVIVIEENKGYSEIIGSASAPYINSLAGQGALFTNSHAITHPSQPNYLGLYSGSTQGVTDDVVPPAGSQYTTANLGAELLAKGLTFGGYSETMPSVGFTGGWAGDSTVGYYERKHNPWVDWQGAGTNQLPSSTNMPYAGYFPTSFTSLPAVSIVVPNQNNDMHDGTISQGDTWLKNNLDTYVQWAKTHNSLFILTFDENDGATGNQITTIFVGQMVQVGQYSENINHYNVLRTIEDMYGLSHAGAAASATPILDCWTSTSTVAPSITAQPSNQTVVAGQTAAFSVTASGTAPLLYQWQKNGSNISGATSSSYTTPATTLSDSSSTFRCVVTNSAGSATSNNATLTVNPAPTAPTITSQPANQTVTAGQTATFSVTASGTAPLSYQWQKNGSNISGATSASYTTPATTLSDNGATFLCVVTNSAGSATSNSATLTVNPPVSSLPSPWVDQDIGAPGVAGSASHDGSTGSFTVLGSGADIWGTSDQCNFAYQPLSGNGEIVARVSGLGNTNAWAKAGVMIRESLAADSTYAFTALTPGNGAVFQRRTATGGSATSTAGPAATAPYWVRLDRSGTTFTSYASADGSTWTLIGSDSIAMATDVYIGFAVTSHDNTATTTGVFDSAAGSGGWTPPSTIGPAPSSSSGSGGHHCGATGVEILILGLIPLARKYLRRAIKLPGRFIAL